LLNSTKNPSASSYYDEWVEVTTGIPFKWSNTLMYAALDYVN